MVPLSPSIIWCSAIMLSGLRPRNARPTGFSADPPPGPAMPVTATAIIALHWRARPAPSRAAAPRRRRASQVSWDVEHLDFGLVGIGDEASVHDIGRSGDLGHCPDDQAARAAFSRCHFPVESAAAFRTDLDRERIFSSKLSISRLPVRGNAGRSERPEPRKSRRINHPP